MRKMGNIAGWAKKIMAGAMALIMVAGFGTVALANESPDRDYETDSKHVLISEADTTIPDIEALMMGDAPADVLGDRSLEDYSTLALFSVAGVDDYDFSEIETTAIRGASINSDMEVQVRFLPTDGTWEKISYSVKNDELLIDFPSEGQLAVFVKDDIVPDDEDPDGDGSTDDRREAGKAPQTGDRLPIYIAGCLMAIAVAGVSIRKIKR